MFCIVSFVVLSILGIFSASNRSLARESLDCVLRRVTLRPCNTGFDEKMKARILGFVITRSEGTAVFLNKHFELLSWIFFFLLLASSIWSVRGLYLFYTTGSCEGLNSSGFCVFDPKGENNQVSTTGVCKVNQDNQAALTLSGVDISSFPVMNPTSPDKIVLVGCYHCEYTRKAYPDITSLVEQFGASFTFLHYPVKEPNDSFSRLSYCVNKIAPQQYWKFNARMFEGQKEILDTSGYIPQMLTSLGIDAKAVEACTQDAQTGKIVEQQMKEVVKTGFYGTPTIFINGTPFVGPKPYRVYAIALKGLFYWLR